MSLILQILIILPSPRQQNEWKGTAKYQRFHRNQLAGSDTSCGFSLRAILTTFLQIGGELLLFTIHLET